MIDYRHIIIDILKEANPYEEIDDKTELIGSGIMNSLTLIFLLTQLQDQMHKKIPEDLVVPENFCTVEKINELLNRIS